MNQPSKKILLAVAGTSPQIVTETLYALVTREKNPWIPDEIHLLSTKTGCDRARNELLDVSRDMFGQFCKEYLLPGQKIRFDESCLHAFTDSDGNPIEDIRDLESSAAVADRIAEKVWELTRDENTEIHASIAGGRKSMGFLLGYCMSLYGRVQDRLSHVLVSEGFESSKDFYFKPKVSKNIHGTQNRELNTEDAEIMLAEIPIVHLGDRLSKHMRDKPVSFAKLVDVMQNYMKEPSIVIDTAKRQLICHGIEIKLSPVNFAFYRYVANESAEKGVVDLENMSIEDFLAIKKLAKVGNWDSDYEAEAIAFYNDKDVQSGDLVSVIAFVRDRKNEIKNAMESQLGALGLKHYVIKKRKLNSYIEVENIEVI